jgi:hypothetical protein
MGFLDSMFVGGAAAFGVLGIVAVSNVIWSWTLGQGNTLQTSLKNTTGLNTEVLA